jgi:hypothetical protein
LPSTSYLLYSRSVHPGDDVRAEKEPLHAKIGGGIVWAGLEAHYSARKPGTRNQADETGPASVPLWENRIGQTTLNTNAAKESGMPTNIRIIHGHDFIKATPEGQLDLEKSKKVLREIASAEAPFGNYEIILDTRKTKTTMSETDLWYLAVELSNLRKAFLHRTAVLCPLERFDYAKFFAICAQNRGFQVNAFTSFEEAIEWLLADGPDA